MILKITYVLSLLFYIVTSGAQGIPDQYKVDWSKAGGATIKYSSDTINFLTEQIENPDISNNDLIDKMIKSLEKAGGTIYFPTGNYFFTRTIQLKSNISIEGKHRDSVRLVFDNKGKGDLISLNGNLGPIITPDANLEKNGTAIKLTTSKIKAGDILYVYDNDENLVTNNWAKGSTGQLFKVVETNENEILLSNSARRAYLVSGEFAIRKISPIKNCKISNISIFRRDHTEIHSSNIFMNYTFNCVIENIRSYKCSYSHVALEKSLNCTVSNCIFFESINFGKGGNGYGVVVQFGTSDCKIEYNSFSTLRHAMLAQCGANGNVFINNTSENPFWTGTLLPSHSAGDIVLHGNYPYANLFKNNTCQHIVIDNSHGNNGSYNTFSENIVESYGIHMNKNSGDGMLFINNKIKRKGIFKGRYKIRGENHFESGNLRKDKKL